MKFSIRDLLLVTVIVALAVGWWVDRKQLLRESSLKRQNGAVEVQGESSQLERYGYRLLPNSSAPARNPPKK